MANTATPRSSLFNGLFYDGVNNRLALYHRGTLAVYLSSNDAVFTDAVTVDDITATTGAVLPQAVTIGGIAYTFPADDGEAGEQLQTNGSGALTWEASGV